jgi:DNA-nicking Smr family endonuclease
MAKRNGKKDADTQVDYHGCTAEQLRHALDRALPSWLGMGRVRVIHGQGTALTPTLLEWCRERGTL